MEKTDETTPGSPDQRSSPSSQMNGSDGEGLDPMEDFNQQLEDIIQTYGSAASLMEQQISSLEAVADRDNQLEEPGGKLEEESGSTPGSAGLLFCSLIHCSKWETWVRCSLAG